MRKSTSLGKLITVFCQKKNLSQDSLRFIFDGGNIEPSQTPQQVIFIIY